MEKKERKENDERSKFFASKFQIPILGFFGFTIVTLRFPTKTVTLRLDI